MLHVLAAETGDYHLHHEGRLKNFLLEAQRSALQPDIQDPLLLWYKLIGIYTKKKLTVESDRVAAILGLADRFGRQTRLSFVGGLWFEDLHRGLLWVKERDKIKIFGSSGPSWSWVSCGTPILFEWFEDPHNRFGSPNGIVPISRRRNKPDLCIVDAAILTSSLSDSHKIRGFVQAWGLVVHVEVDRGRGVNCI